MGKISAQSEESLALKWQEFGGCVSQGATT